MKILIKTPFYQNNKYLPHLLEHCLLESKDLWMQLQLSDIDAASYTWYTSFEREHISVENILSYLQKPITEETCTLHQKIIKKELRNIWFWQRIYEKTLQKIFSQELLTNSLDNVQFEQVVEYQKKHYQIHNMLLVNENDEIDQQRGKGQTLQPLSPKLSEYQIPEYYWLRYQWEQSYVLVTKEKSPVSILILDFFWDLCEALWYREETQKWKYFSWGFDYSFTDQGFLVSREENFPRFSLKKRKSFFEIFKVYYCESITLWAKRSYIPHIALFFGVFISQKEHKKLISSLDFSLILNLLKQFKLI